MKNLKLSLKTSLSAAKSCGCGGNPKITGGKGCKPVPLQRNLKNNRKSDASNSGDNNKGCGGGASGPGSVGCGCIQANLARLNAQKEAYSSRK